MNILFLSFNLLNSFSVIKPLIDYCLNKKYNCFLQTAHIFNKLGKSALWHHVNYLRKKGLKIYSGNSRRTDLMKEDLSWIKFKSFIEDNDIQVVITPNESTIPDHKFTHNIIKEANSLNLLTLVLQHGLPNMPTGFIPFASKYFLLWGENSFKYFLNQNIPKDRLQIIGCPKFDVLANMQSKEKTTITLATNTHWRRYSKQNSIDLLKCTYSAIEEHNQHLTIKTHPLESDAKLKELHLNYLKGFNVKPNIIRDGNLYDLIHKSKMLIQASTTVGLEAVIAGVPVITANFADFKTGIDDLTYVAKTKKEFGKIFQTLLTENPKQCVIEKILNQYILLYNSCDRINKFILEKI